MADYSLTVNVEAIDKASKIFSSISKNAESFKKEMEGVGASGKTGMEALGNSMQDVGSKMASTGKVMTATVTAPVVALGTAAVKTASDFDTQMSKVKAISGATGKEMDDLRKKAREMGAKTKFSAKEAGQGFEYMAMAGWKTADMLDGIEGIMNLAAASGEDLGTTSDIVTDALTAFGLEAKDSAHFADVLAAASSNSNTNVSMMGETFKYAAPIAGALGYSVEDTALAIGLMANSGIKASQAGTSLRTIMSKLTGDLKICGRSLGTVEIATSNADGTMRDFSDILEDCRVAFAGLTEEEKVSAAESIVGKNAMSGFLALMNAGQEDISKLTGALGSCNGVAKDMADTMNDNLEGQLTILKSQLAELAISFGEILIPVVRDAVGVLQNVVDWFNSIPAPLKEIITKVAAVAAVAGPLILIGGKIIGGIGKIISLGSQVGGIIGGVGSAAGAAAPAVSAAGGAMGVLSANAIGFVALGAGILLAATGIALLAQAAIALGEAGPPAAFAMVGLVAALAALMGLAALLGPALTAGAVGMVAFGVAIALVGVGVLAASAGLSMLAAQLPTIVEYGGSAAAAILELSGALLVFAAGSLAGGAGALVLGAGLMVAGTGALFAGAGALVLGAGLVVAAAGLVLCAGGSALLGVALTLCGAALVLIAGNAGVAAGGLMAMAGALLACAVPAGALAAAIGLADLALLAFDLEVGLGAIAVLAMDVALLGMLASMNGIADAAVTASTSMKDIQSSLDIVKAGLDGLGDAFMGAINAIIGVFASETPTAAASATEFATAITQGVETGLKPVVTVVTAAFTAVCMAVQSSMAKARTVLALQCTMMQVALAASMVTMEITVQTGTASIQMKWANALQQMLATTGQLMSKVKTSIQTALLEIQQQFANTKLAFNQHIALPHFSMSGSFNAETGQTPSVNVSWFRKAYDQAYMFNTPTVFGANGFGDGAGTEVVVGDEHLIDLIREAMSGGTAQATGDTIIPVYIGQERIDEIVIRANQRQALLSGGR